MSPRVVLNNARRRLLVLVRISAGVSIAKSRVQAHSGMLHQVNPGPSSFLVAKQGFSTIILSDVVSWTLRGFRLTLRELSLASNLCDR